MTSIPTIIVVSGLPASGKSTVAARLQAHLRWPLFAKDAFKETLFDTLGVGDRAWSRRLSQAAYALQFAQARQCLAVEQSCLLEGNFRWRELAGEFDSLIVPGVRAVQLHCRAEPEVLVARFRERMSVRHAGHADQESAAEIEQELRAIQEPLPLNGEVIVCDTTGDWQAAMDAAVARMLTILKS